MSMKGPVIDCSSKQYRCTSALSQLKKNVLTDGEKK